MTETTPPPGSRGAVDLSAVAGAPASPPSSSGTVPEGLVVELQAANLQQTLSRTVQVPGVLVIWSSAHPQTVEFRDSVVRVAAGMGGRILVVTADLSREPELAQAFTPLLTQAFGQASVPATFGLLQGQPVPLFPGLAPEKDIREALDQVVQAAVQNGITGRVELSGDSDLGEEPLPPLHQEAFDAIERDDLPGAVAAYEKALAENPSDTEAATGLAQVHLMQRAAGVDPATVRAAAAANPADIDAAIAVADLDVSGGHVEDAFTRLLDLVRSSAGDDRERVRTHLLELFTVVGPQDERVRKGRTALMSALF